MPRFRDMLQLRTVVRSFGLRLLAAHPLPALDARGSAGGERTHEYGPDPIRILLFGEGPLLGYGAHTRQEGIDGHLARTIADETGRGVIIENRTVQHLAVSRALESLGASGTATFHVAVWTPSYLECTERYKARSWRHAIGEMLRRYTAVSEVPIVVLGYPIAAGMHPAALILRKVGAATNQGAAEAVDEIGLRRVRVALPPPVLVRELGRTTISPQMLRDTADVIVPEVLAALGIPARFASPRA